MSFELLPTPTINVTVAFYPVPDDNGVASFGALTVAAAPDWNLSQLKQRLVNQLHDEEFLAPNETRSTRKMKAVLFGQAEMPLMRELASPATDIHELYKRACLADETTSFVAPDAASTFIQAVIFHPTFHPLSASRSTGSHTPTPPVPPVQDTPLAGISDLPDGSDVLGRSSRPPISLAHKPKRPTETSFTQPSPAPEPSTSNVRGAVESNEVEADRVQEELLKRKRKPSEDLVIAMPKKPKRSARATKSLTPASTNGSEIRELSPAVVQDAEPESAQKVRARKQQEAEEDAETSILNVSHAFHSRGSRNAAKLYFGTPLRTCRSYARSQKDRQHPAHNKSLYVKCHDAEAADAHTSLLYDSKNEKSVKLWRALDNLCLSGCDSVQIRSGRPEQNLETGLSVLRGVLAALAQISPRLKRLDMHRFRSELKPDDLIPPIKSRLTELHLSFGSYSLDDIKALIVSSSETLRRVCLVVVKPYLTMRETVELIPLLPALQEFNLCIYRNGGELYESVEGGGLAKFLDAVADHCPFFERLSLTLERPQLIPLTALDIIRNAPLTFRERLKRLDITNIEADEIEAWSALLEPDVLPSIRLFGCPDFRKVKSGLGERRRAMLEKRARLYGVKLVKTEQHCGCDHGELDGDLLHTCSRY